MSAPEPLSPSHLQLVMVAGDLRDQVAASGAWGGCHAAADRYGYRGHQTSLRLLKLLVYEGYLSHEAGLSSVAPDPVVAAAREN